MEVAILDLARRPTVAFVSRADPAGFTGWLFRLLALVRARQSAIPSCLLFALSTPLVTALMSATDPKRASPVTRELRGLRGE